MISLESHEYLEQKPWVKGTVNILYNAGFVDEAWTLVNTCHRFSGRHAGGIHTENNDPKLKDLMYSFGWDNTPQGHYFWKDINDVLEKKYSYEQRQDMADNGIFTLDGKLQVQPPPPKSGVEVLNANEQLMKEKYPDPFDVYCMLLHCKMKDVANVLLDMAVTGKFTGSHGHSPSGWFIFSDTPQGSAYWTAVLDKINTIPISEQTKYYYHPSRDSLSTQDISIKPVKTTKEYEDAVDRLDKLLDKLLNKWVANDCKSLITFDNIISTEMEFNLRRSNYT